MPEFVLTRPMLDDINDVEMAFGTTKFLPPTGAVPEDFKRDNDYARLVHCLFFGEPLPGGQIEFRDGFSDADAPSALNRVVMAHLRSFEPKHEHKIAGVAYLVSLVCDVRLDPV